MASKGRASTNLRPLVEEANEQGYNGAILNEARQFVAAGMPDGIPKVRLPALHIPLHTCDRLYTSHL